MNIKKYITFIETKLKATTRNWKSVCKLWDITLK